MQHFLLSDKQKVDVAQQNTNAGKGCIDVAYRETKFPEEKSTINATYHERLINNRSLGKATSMLSNLHPTFGFSESWSAGCTICRINAASSTTNEICSRNSSLLGSEKRCIDGIFSFPDVSDGKIFSILNCLYRSYISSMTLQISVRTFIKRNICQGIDFALNIYYNSMCNRFPFK